MNETNRCSDDEPIEQGDIVILSNEVGHEALPEYAVVINADCDLAHHKIDGVIALLPIFTFPSYLEKFWVASFIANELKQNTIWVLDTCKLPHSESEDLCRWLQSDNHTIISNALIEENCVAAKKQAELRRRVERCAIMASGSGLSALGQVSKSEADPSKYVRKHIEAARKEIGEGHFFLSEISGQDGLGFVVRMRRIISIRANLCFTSIANMRSYAPDSVTCAARVARLTPTYKYRIAQLFGYQYSRIGLPDETTELSEIAVDDAIYQIVGTP